MLPCCSDEVCGVSCGNCSVAPGVSCCPKLDADERRRSLILGWRDECLNLSEGLDAGCWRGGEPGSSGKE